MIVSLALTFLAVILTGFSQVLLKVGSRRAKGKGHFLPLYFNLPTLTAYVLFFCITVISIIALIEVPLKLFYAIASLNFVVVPFFSWILLGESAMNRNYYAILLVFAGVLVFNF